MPAINNRYATPEAFVTSRDGFPNGAKKLLLLGPPGTGKTRNVLEAFIQPALNYNIDPEAILSCSFTRAAARELRDRLAKATGVHPHKLLGTCSTIHAEALRRFRAQFPLKNYNILGDTKSSNTDEDDGEGPASRFLEEAIPQGMDINSDIAIRIWDLARNKLIYDNTSPEFTQLVYAFGVGGKLNEVRRWINEFEKKKIEGRLLDFTDILTHALRCAPPKRELLIVDEAQDCTLLQWKVVEKWANAANRIVYVGDLDQALYEWNGGSPEKMMAMLENGFACRRLARSYRVPAKVHALARTVITKNRTRIDAPYEPHDKDGVAVELPFKTAVEQLAEASDDGKEAFVLARGAKLLEPWVDALSEEGIPFINERGRSPWGSPIALSITRAVMAIRNSGPIDTNDARRLVEAFPGRNAEFFEKGKTKKGIVSTLKEWGRSTIQVTELEDLGLVLGKTKTETLQKLLLELDLKDRARSLALLIEKNGPAALNKKPTIRLTTMHGSKGREADLVVVEMEAPTATKISISKNPANVEAERRLCYVAFTRSKDTLVLVRRGYDLGVICGLGRQGE